METMIEILNWAGGMIAALFAVFSYECLRKIAGWKTNAEIETLRRRVADLEAMRRIDACASQIERRTARGYPPGRRVPSLRIVEPGE